MLGLGLQYGIRFGLCGGEHPVDVGCQGVGHRRAIKEAIHVLMESGGSSGTEAPSYLVSVPTKQVEHLPGLPRARRPPIRSCEQLLQACRFADARTAQELAGSAGLAIGAADGQVRVRDSLPHSLLT